MINLAASELPSPDKCNYIIHKGNAKYQLYNVSISKGILSGYTASFKPYNENSVQIFIPSDSGLELKPSTKFSINLDEVSKIEIKKSNPGAQ